MSSAEPRVCFTRNTDGTYTCTVFDPATGKVLARGRSTDFERAESLAMSRLRRHYRNSKEE